ncbi:MAG TPA: hypothetical protein VFO10_20455 [Oligoflexus sp.]|uniref:hypothetical protein n=1 Tax=Oligoflexus sp. TaxID=1971216 RepID=UPI002D7E5480|nr:hypothetical protein [Oligoflexus sp.]HET9239643.1 hypothetical protein [Oligoflexus sp.]
MIPARLRSFLEMISVVCLNLAVLTPEARAERMLDLQFWAPETSALALGGLWEFHAETLLEPAERRLGSDLLLEISQPWRDYRPLTGGVQEPLARGSYVLLVKGLTPRPDGYAVKLASLHSMSRVIVAPKYAPGRAQRVQTASIFTVFPLLRYFMDQKLQLVFKPETRDEIWMIIVQRWQAAPNAWGSIPRLQFAEKNP